MRKEILAYLMRRKAESATQIAHALKMKPASVSSECYRMFKEGALTREDGKGPRGGYAYSLPYAGPQLNRFERDPVI